MLGGTRGDTTTIGYCCMVKIKRCPLMKMSASVSIRSKRTVISQTVKSFLLLAIAVSNGS
jgi:hypothetical protein